MSRKSLGSSFLRATLVCIRCISSYGLAGQEWKV